ncbi:MAG: flagellar export protein FliJ [Betaproteobacteria bacterium]|nr:flagellar export protein FliJ [Betaproteobacteria bacterium]
MSRPFPLQTLLEVSRSRLDEATRELGRLLAAETSDEQKLALLTGYRDEYLGRFREAVAVGMAPEQWRNFRAFLERLDQAVAQQQQNVDMARERRHAGQRQVVDQRTRAKAFDLLEQRHHLRQSRIEAKREQRISDDHGAKRRMGDQDNP